MIPLVDLMNLGSEGRFNVPGKPAGNWQWRYRPAQLDRLAGAPADYLRDLAEIHGREAGGAAARVEVSG